MADKLTSMTPEARAETFTDVGLCYDADCGDWRGLHAAFAELIAAAEAEAYEAGRKAERERIAEAVRLVFQEPIPTSTVIWSEHQLRVLRAIKETTT